MKHTWRILTTTEDHTGRVIKRTLYRLRTDWATLDRFVYALIGKGRDVLVTRVEAGNA